MDEPPVRLWLMGANEWRTEHEWPLARTRWTRLFLRSSGRLAPEPEPADDASGSFVQAPPSQTAEVAELAYATEAFPHDTEVIGPLSLTLYAAIDQPDTNWIVALEDEIRTAPCAS